MFTKSSSTFLNLNRSVSVATDLYDRSSRIQLNKSRTGERLPKHKELISKGISATTPMSAFEEIATFRPGSTRATLDYNNGNPIWPAKVVDTWQGLECIKRTFDVPDSLVNASIADARARAFSKIRGLQTPFETLTLLGETAEVIRLLKNPFKEAIDLTRTLAAARHNDAAADVGKLWLQYRFGIVPLISDMNSILKLVEKKKLDISRSTFKVYGVAKDGESLPTTYGSVGMDSLYYVGYINRIQKAETFIRCGVDLEQLDKGVSYSAIALDTVNDLSSVAITAWELLPWSFLIDYFVNIGDLIQSSTVGTSLLSYTSESVVKTFETFDVVTGYDYGNSNRFLKVNQFTPSSFSYRRREVTRSGGSLAIPPLTVSVPGSNIRYANMAALFAVLNQKKG